MKRIMNITLTILLLVFSFYYTNQVSNYLKNKAIIAFEIGNGEIEEEGFRLIGAHTDSPCFKVKPSPEMLVENKYVKLNTEVYGGPILNTWFDRPLSLAGRVTLNFESHCIPLAYAHIVPLVSSSIV